MSSQVVVVGDANVDLIVHFPRFVSAPELKVIPPAPEMHGGGTAANSAIALSRLQIPTAFIGTVGNDSYGQFILDNLQAEAVDTRQVFVDPTLNTVVVFAFIDEQGERYLWGWPRTRQAHTELGLEKIDFDAIYQAAWVHTTGMLLRQPGSARSTAIEILRKAQAAGISTSLDLNLRVENLQLDSGCRAAVLEAIQYCSVVFGSGEDEYQYLEPAMDWRAAARGLVNPKRAIVVRMGARGAMLLTAEGETHMPAYQVNVVDTVGAGDIFNAGFIAASLRGLSGEEALRWGNAVSAYKIMHTGARGSPRLSELEEFFRAYRVFER
jgi:fructokinase